MTSGFRPTVCTNPKCKNTDSPINGDGFIKTVMSIDDDIVYICNRCGGSFTEQEHEDYLKHKKTDYDIEHGKFDREPTDEDLKAEAEDIQKRDVAERQALDLDYYCPP